MRKLLPILLAILLFSLNAPAFAMSVEESEVYVADGHHRTAAAARVGQKLMKENPNHTGNDPWSFTVA